MLLAFFRILGIASSGDQSTKRGTAEFINKFFRELTMA